MPWLPYLPFPLLATLMLGDELVCHRSRGLGAWETFGHPLDTLFALAPLLALLAGGPTPLFAALAIFSCVLVTKDELLHARHCGPGEHWLHSCLFLLHPTCFFAAAALYERGDLPFLRAQAALTAAFGLLQLLTWGTSWARFRSRST